MYKSKRDQIFIFTKYYLAFQETQNFIFNFLCNEKKKKRFHAFRIHHLITVLNEKIKIIRLKIISLYTKFTYIWYSSLFLSIRFLYFHYKFYMTHLFQYSARDMLIKFNISTKYRTP